MYIMNVEINQFIMLKSAGTPFFCAKNKYSASQSAPHQRDGRLVSTPLLPNDFDAEHFVLWFKGDVQTSEARRYWEYRPTSETAIGVSMTDLINNLKAEHGTLPTDSIHLLMFESLIRKEEERVARNNNRATKIGLPATLTLPQWLWTLNQFNFRCAYCRKAPYGTMDHVRPLAHGGGTTGKNCVPACKECNQRHEQVLTRQREAKNKLNQLLCALHID